ncbi:substrate-binding domain-containing protein [Allosphingosinicella indica]|uniref:Phosphate ABC transporter substrate-binding protein, PhoT family n=1 Tax=Allosphingosinicella indica TaxID=941907 RepID=A0A1X7GI33_9SPHN|nr:substrate-binding domain-containing protein [Allosphingosinicella indica]SMF69746.1 phosphate ABC transporter substrate-binding protein, PhoT family [Allosphingosinicella indica]
MRILLGLGAAAVLLAGCGDGAGGGQQSAVRPIRAVGSSTVYPFTTAVAEQFARANPQFGAPTVESTGTGGGMKLFCAGVGINQPDVVNASRRMKRSEYADCANNGVDQVIELQIGIDGIAFVESNNGPRFKLTPAQVYQALAKTPYGKPQTAVNWSDVDPALPKIKIQVYGPPPTSGTRDALAELILEKGCDANAEMKALKEKDSDQHKTVCTTIREDGVYVEAGENDNLLIQKVEANPTAIGVLGYSFLERNSDKVHGVPLNDVTPTYETISTFAYPGARPLYVYVKGQHLDAIPGLREFVAEYAKSWNPDGLLVKRGLIASPDAQRTAATDVAAKFTALDPNQLK